MKAFFLRVLTRIVGVSRSLADFLLPLLAGATAAALEALLPVALGIVTELSTRPDLTGPEKRDLATSRLKEAALSTGLTVGASTLNLAVEMAVTKLREVK